MLDIMYEIPKDDSIGEVIITRAYIEGTGGPGDPAEGTGSAYVRAEYGHKAWQVKSEIRKKIPTYTDKKYV